MPLSKPVRRILLWGGGALLLLALVAIYLARDFSRTFYPDPPVASFPPPTDLRMAQLQDLEYFEHYFALNRSYTPQAIDTARELLVAYREEAGTLSAAEFDLAIARMVALADNGHSQVFPGHLARRHPRIPCRLYRFADGYYIVRARPECADLLGGRILAINGRGIEGVVEELYPYVSGPRNRFDQYASAFFLESPALLQAAGAGYDAERMTIRVLLYDGSQVEMELASDPANPEGPSGFGDAYLSPEPLEREENDWITILTADTEIPFFLREQAIPFRTEFLADWGIYHAQFRSNMDEAGYSIRDFVRQVRREVRELSPRALVLDLRFDQGGDFTTTASLMKDLTNLSDSVQHIYLLTSAWTFSAAITSAALAKEHGGDRVTIMGEPVGDRLRSWGEGGTLTLPNSGLALGFASGLHDYTGSCFGEEGCFWITFLHPMNVESLDPEVAVNYTFDDYLGLRDPALDRVRELIGLLPGIRRAPQSETQP